MDKEEILFKLEQIKAVFNLLSYLNEDAKITDVAYIATAYKVIVQCIIENIK